MAILRGKGAVELTVALLKNNSIPGGQSHAGCFCGHDTLQSDSREHLSKSAHCEVGCTLDYFPMTGAAAATQCLFMMCWDSQTLTPIIGEH